MKNKNVLSEKIRSGDLSGTKQTGFITITNKFSNPNQLIRTYKQVGSGEQATIEYSNDALISGFSNKKVEGPFYAILSGERSPRAFYRFHVNEDYTEQFYIDASDAEKYDSRAQATSDAPQSPTGDQWQGRSYRCSGGVIAKFQNWLKKQGQKICADDKLGSKTFAAAKAVGIDLTDAVKKNQICSTLSADTRWANESATPEVCGGRTTGGSKKTSIAPQSPKQKQIIQTLASADASWQQESAKLEGDFPGKGMQNYYSNAYNTIPPIRSKIDLAASRGTLDTNFLFGLNNEINQYKQDKGLQESYSFHDKLKINNAKMLYEKLINLYSRKG